MKINKTLLKGSIILLFSFGIFNFLNFVFQLSMARMLNLVDYGIFATLFAMIYMWAVFTESVQTIVVKYSSVENDKGKLNNILRKTMRKAFFFGAGMFFIYLVVAIPLTYLLHISYSLLALNGLIIFSSFLLPVNRGIMQGKKRFGVFGLNMVLESVSKLVLAVAFVYIGWRVYGAILGTIFGTFFAFAISFVPIRDIIKSKIKKAETVGIYQYAKPAFFVTFFIIVFYTMDIIIAKMVFSPETAGVYAIASILSKIIFWGTQPISRAMFPLSSEGKKGKDSGNVFANSLVLVSIGIACALIVFYFFSDLIINVFAGKVIEDASNILFYLGIATGITSITNLILLHKLSLNKMKGYGYLSIFLVVEIFLLFYFSHSLIQFSFALIFSSMAFLWGSIMLLKD